MTLAKEVVAAIVADGCRNNKRTAEHLRLDCRRALEDLIGARVPDGVNISAAQNTADTVHVPLPHYSRNLADEVIATMSEAELKQISGGEIIVAGIIIAGIGAVLISGVVVLGLALSGKWEEEPAGQPGGPGSGSGVAVRTVGESPALS